MSEGIWSWNDEDKEFMRFNRQKNENYHLKKARFYFEEDTGKYRNNNTADSDIVFYENCIDYCRRQWMMFLWLSPEEKDILKNLVPEKIKFNFAEWKKKGRAKMKNKISDLTNYLFEQIERVNDDSITDEELDTVIKKATTVNELSKSLIACYDQQIKVVQVAIQNGLVASTENTITGLLGTAKDVELGCRNVNIQKN